MLSARTGPRWPGSCCTSIPCESPAGPAASGRATWRMPSGWQITAISTCCAARRTDREIPKSRRAAHERRSVCHDADRNDHISASPDACWATSQRVISRQPCFSGWGSLRVAYAEIDHGSGARLALPERLRVSRSTRPFGSRLGIPAAQSGLSAGLSDHHSNPRENRVFRSNPTAMGIAISLSNPGCEPTAPRSSGCPGSIPRPYCLRRHPHYFVIRAASRASDRYLRVLQMTATIG